MEQLSFDSPAETDVVRRFRTSAKGFVFDSPGTRTRDLPHGSSALSSHTGEKKKERKKKKKKKKKKTYIYS